MVHCPAPSCFDPFQWYMIKYFFFSHAQDNKNAAAGFAAGVRSKNVI
jgi:hypothetical protein